MPKIYMKAEKKKGRIMKTVRVGKEVVGVLKGCPKKLRKEEMDIHKELGIRKLWSGWSPDEVGRVRTNESPLLPTWLVSSWQSFQPGRVLKENALSNIILDWNLVFNTRFNIFSNTRFTFNFYFYPNYFCWLCNF